MPLEERYRKRMALGQGGNHLVGLMVAIAVVFIIFRLIFAIYDMASLGREDYYQNIFDWFRLPADLNTLASRPWTIITYMFLHDGFMHVIGNLLWLWAFGFIMQDLAGNGKIIPIFLYGGFAGGIFFLLSYNLIPKLAQVDHATIEGASAGVMAIAVATTMLAPDYRIFPMLNGGIPLWVLTVIFVIIDFALIPGANSGGHIAHLAGGATGFLFIYQMRRGRDWSGWMHRFYDWISNLFNPDRKRIASATRKKYFYKVGKTDPYRKVPHVTQKRIDDILDKINQKGYRFLTDEEKEILKRASEEDNL